MSVRKNNGRKRSSVVTLGFAALLVASTALADHDHGDGGGVQVGTNVQVNDPQQKLPNDDPGRNTTTIAASDDGQQLLAGWEDFQGLCGPPSNVACPPQNPPGLSGFGFSLDGGLTWTDGGSPYPIGHALSAGHPWVDRGTFRDSHGHGHGDEGDDEGGREIFFFTSRLRDDTTGADVGVSIHRGHFGNATFVWDDAQIINSSNPGDFYSREAIAAAKDGSGAAYVVLCNVIDLCNLPAFGFGQIEVWRTHDGGATWQGPVIVSPDASEITDPSDPLCGDTGPQQVAPAVAIGPHGEVYTVWQYGPEFFADGSNSPNTKIAFSRSLDGGQTFNAPSFITTLNANRDNPPVGYGKNRMNDQPRIAVATTGEHRGRIYVTIYQAVQPVTGAVTAQSLVSAQIYLTYSDDRGQTWSAPAVIGTPVPPTGIKRFWPTVAVRPGGDVDVVYLESQETQATPNPTDVECNVPTGQGRRIGPVSSLVDTYWTESRDGGASFGPRVRVSSQTSNWCLAAYTFGGFLLSNFGDYIGVATGGDRTLTVWPDERNGFSDVYFADVKSNSDHDGHGHD
ncbi:MAG TPA: sialidase family protein [Thermoanaerobaculia bacterium]|nr:sialidase family protein [Thermoanaerobaculia bacterium]